jgi:carboxyl-terminal processing protease
MGNKKLQVWLPLLFSLVMIIGMLFGYQLNTSGTNGKGFFSTSRTTTLQEALDLIRLKYVDSVNFDSLEGGAIMEMMTELDPHSVYYPPVEVKGSVEELAGKFDGIGIEFSVFDDTVNITHVLPDGPSDKAGLKIGDKILTSDSVSLTGKDNAVIIEHIKGEAGSIADLQILRNGQKMNIGVKRGSIPQLSIDAAYMIDNETGYIKLNRFTETSYEEFMRAMEDLKKQGLRRLIYDLRGNGGGFMDEAVNMADEFLSGDKMIVFTDGLNRKKEEYKGKRPGLFEEGKLVILVDQSSASASEVLSGALQDWDRATIVGRRTFGKGLVQQQFPLSDGSAIRLTIARYYTPLGRSIQRPYDKGKKAYMDEFWERQSNGEALYADSNHVNIGLAYKTPGGRILYGGGGIMPDVFVPIDTSSYPVAVSNLLLQGHLSNFVYVFYLKNRALVDGFKSPQEFVQRFNSQLMWENFVSFAASRSVDLNGLTEKQKESLKTRLIANLARYRWRSTGFYQVLNHDDPAFVKALEIVKK